MNWTPLKKVLLRFAFLYFFLCVTPLSAFIVLQKIPPAPNGSGDQLFHYVLTLLNLLLAAFGCLLWSLFDRRTNYEKLAWFLYVCCRYYLSFVLIGYGFAKLLPVQFPFPDLEDLIIPMGQMSPMGLVWRMMGFSAAYSFFAGLAEVAGGLLLLSRRTTSLGALIIVAVMSNVVMLNLCYDIPVKLLSTHLLLMAMALLIPDTGRLVNFFILNRPVCPANLAVEIKNPLFLKARMAGKTLFALFSIGFTLFFLWRKEPALPPLYGIYEVVENPSKLRYVIFDKHWTILSWMNDTRESFHADFEANTLLLKREEKSLKFTYLEEGDRLILDGELEGKAALLTLKKKSDFLLINRGFHWINESPLNR